MLCCAAATAACNLAGLDDQRQVGLAPIPPEISMPDSARVGVPFEVSIGTIGLNGCWRKGSTEVESTGVLAVTITPYDIDQSTDGFACTQALLTFTHTATLRFDAGGEAAVTFRVRSSTDRRIVTFERRLRVE